MAQSSYTYCIHCERSYPDGEHRIQEVNGKSLRLCPYDGCDGGVFIDGWDWDTIRGYHPTYPEIPEKGVVYPLH